MQNLYTEISTKIFQERFNELLKNYNGTYNDLAKALNLKSENIIFDIINGSTNINISLIDKIANYFGVSSVWLMGYDVDKNYKYKKMTSL